MGESGWENVCPIDPESVLLDPVLNYVYFTTPAEFVNGNVGIAAYDEAGEILWSWNIWAVEGYDYDLEARTVGRYTVMDRNLGAMAGKEAMQASIRAKPPWPSATTTSGAARIRSPPLRPMKRAANSPAA